MREVSGYKRARECNTYREVRATYEIYPYDQITFLTQEIPVSLRKTSFVVLAETFFIPGEFGVPRSLPNRDIFSGNHVVTILDPGGMQRHAGHLSQYCAMAPNSMADSYRVCTLA